jgi:hypothetical protein
MTRRATNVEKRHIGILQTEEAKALHSTALHKVGKKGPATQGNLDPTNHAQQGIQGFTGAKITKTEQEGKIFEMGVE